MKVEVQNENLVAMVGDEPVLTTPDLICMIDQETLTPITTEAISFGNRVRVIGMPCAPEWYRDGYLDLVGPKAFGYDFDHVEALS